VVVGVARIVLALGQAHSLKEKRAVVRKVIDRVRAHHPVAIGEVADQDLWQRATLGISAVGPDAHQVRGLVESAVRAVEALYVAPVIQCDVQVDHYDELDFAGTTGQGPDAFSRELLAGDDE
jgi:uncharacterized protein YlxP (DUF503 family)